MVEKINTKGNINTKEKLELAALELFSRKGYQAVSIRDICGVVGIKESSVYYHFKNKQALMDSLINKVDGIVEEMREGFDRKFTVAENVSEEAMGEVAVGILENYLLHPYVFKVISILSIERMRDAGADINYHKLLFDLPLAQQEKIFGEMMDRGYIKKNQAAILAQEYQAIIYFAFQKNCVGPCLEDSGIETAKREIRNNIRDIYRKMLG